MKSINQHPKCWFMEFFLRKTIECPWVNLWTHAFVHHWLSIDTERFEWKIHSTTCFAQFVADIEGPVLSTFRSGRDHLAPVVPHRLVALCDCGTTWGHPAEPEGRGCWGTAGLSTAEADNFWTLVLCCESKVNISILFPPRAVSHTIHLSLWESAPQVHIGKMHCDQENPTTALLFSVMSFQPV